MQNVTERAIHYLEKLISFPVLGGESNLSISQYIEDVFKEHDIDYHQVFNEDKDKVSLHCRIGPAVDGGTILSGHTDVVSVEGQPWTRKTFELTRENGKLYGRGTADMKGFLACCLAMIPLLQQAPLKRPIYFAFSYDEEIGCLAGPALIEHIIASYTEKPAYAIIGEPSSMQTINAEKGIGMFTTTIKSSAAHSSEIRTSVSAINEATYLIQWLNGRMEKLLYDGKIDERFDPPHTTIHVGTIKGGTAVNIVADACSFEWDIRNIPSDDIQEIIDEYETYCREREQINSSTNSDFRISTKANFPVVLSLNTPENEDIVTMVNQWTNTVVPGTVSFGSEAGQYAAAGFRTVLCGPGNMAQGHRADEYLEIRQLEKCISFIDKLKTSQIK